MVGACYSPWLQLRTASRRGRTRCQLQSRVETASHCQFHDATAAEVVKLGLQLDMLRALQKHQLKKEQTRAVDLFEQRRQEWLKTYDAERSQAEAKLAELRWRVQALQAQIQASCQPSTAPPRMKKPCILGPRLDRTQAPQYWGGAADGPPKIERVWGKQPRTVARGPWRWAEAAPALRDPVPADVLAGASTSESDWVIAAGTRPAAQPGEDMKGRIMKKMEAGMLHALQAASLPPDCLEAEALHVLVCLAFDAQPRSAAQQHERTAACVALLAALAALAEKDGLSIARGAVADAVAGRAACEVGAIGVLLLAQGAGGRPKTPEQVAEDVAALRVSCRALAGLYVRGLLAGAVICVLLSELALRTRLGAANPVHARELLATALAALLGGCGATYVERWARDAPAGVALPAHLGDLRAALRGLITHAQPLPPELRRELELINMFLESCNAPIGRQPSLSGLLAATALPLPSAPRRTSWSEAR
ncbi:hypothetical protein WJX81_000259 [Elliptochloris bilobata]|uniref:FRIGIDA-like protein n=1 Tax=Elliptochloris bilobata TaxID=381761 RepID=A0AAW1RQ47_9CHLO